MAKKQAPAKGGGKKRDVLVVGSKVREYIKTKKSKKGKPFMTSSELLEALSEKVYCLLDAAMARAEGNDRSTIRARDL